MKRDDPTRRGLVSPTRRRLLKAGGTGAALALLGGNSLIGAHASQHRVNFYSPETPDMTQQMAAAYTELTGIPVDVTYGGTHVILSRLRAEARRPVADLWYGAGGLVPFEVFREDGFLEPYIPTGWEDLPVRNEHGLMLRDADWHWVAAEIFVIGLAFNNRLVDEDEVPRNWDDLLDERWRGEIQMPNPGVSGTATLFVMGQIQRLGWDAGWEYLTELVQQTSAIPDSGAAPTRAVARGEASLAICFDFMPYQLAAQRGEPVGFVLPDPSPILANPVAFMNNGPNPEAGKAFIDWLLAGDGGQRIIGEWSHLPLSPDVDREMLARPTVLADVVHATQDLDVDWLVENFEPIRDEWRRRFV